MNKRIFSIFLCISLVVGLLPVQIFAAGAAESGQLNVAMGAEVLSASYNEEDAYLSFDGDLNTTWLPLNSWGWVTFRIPYSARIQTALLHDEKSVYNTGVSLWTLKSGLELPQDKKALHEFCGDDNNWILLGKEQNISQRVTDIPVNMDADGSIFRCVVYAPGNVSARIGELEMFAASVKVQFAPGEGSGTMDPMRISTDHEVCLPAPTFTAPAGKVFQKWVAIPADAAVISGNKITATEELTLEAVYADAPAGEPVSNGNGTHTADGVEFMCIPSVCEPSQDGMNHVLKCTCGYVLETHPHKAGDKYISNGNDSHDIRCSDCDAVMRTEKCSDFTYTDNGDGTHNSICNQCGNVRKNIACTGHTYKSKDSQLHTAVCICGHEISEEKHESGSKFIYGENDTHYSKCIKCGEPIYAPCEKELVSEQYLGDTYHTFQCKFCKHKSEQKFHHYEWTSDAEGLSGYGIYTCKECGHQVTLPYASEKGKLRVSIWNDNPKHGISLKIHADGQEIILTTGERENYELDEKLQLTVEMLKRTEYSSRVQMAVTGAKGEPVAFYHQKPAEAYGAGELIYTNIDHAQLADFTAIHEAKAAIPEDLSVYTVSSVQALDRALQELPNEETTTDQKIVDQAAQKLRAAIAGLTKTPEMPGESRKITLAEGQTLTITQTGYAVDDGKETAYTGSYELTGQGKAVRVLSGIHEITLQDLFLLHPEESPFDVESGANVHLTLNGVNRMNVLSTSPVPRKIDWYAVDANANHAAGLHVAESAGLLIDGDGLLNVRGGIGAAGIGGHQYENTGRITIRSGVINAAGMKNGVGIGGGRKCGAGLLRFYGGTVYATHLGGDGTGIGSGDGGHGGVVKIFGGDITAESTGWGAAIGGGKNGMLDLIEISGGNVIAKSNSEAAAIGGGNNCKHAGTIRITGGTVDACSGLNGAGIGGPADNNAPITIEISGGKVTARCKENGAAIGGGQNNKMPITIKITGGEVHAHGNDGAAIGSGEKAEKNSLCDISISNAQVEVQSNNGAGIGSGNSVNNGAHCNIRICDADIKTLSKHGAGIGGGNGENCGKIHISDSTILCENRCDVLIGSDHPNSSITGENYVHLKDVTLFTYDSGVDGYMPLNPENWKISPVPTTPDGGDLMLLTKNTDRADGPAIVVLSDNTRVETQVRDGNVSLLTAKAENNPDDFQIVDYTADYTEVDAAIAKAEAIQDKTSYKNYDAVEKAIAAVERNLLPSQQETVDGYAQAILTAIENLQKIKIEVKVELRRLDKVPESLKNTPFNTVEKITSAMKAKVVEKLNGTDAMFVTYDLMLIITEDGVPRPATKEEIEEQGSITVILPYPVGTNREQFAFNVAHMLGAPMNGMEPGHIEIPNITYKENGLQVTLNGLSPVMVAHASKTVEPETPETEEPSNPETEEPGTPEMEKPGNPETAEPSTPATGDGLAPVVALCVMLMTGLMALYLAEQKKRVS